MCSFLVFASVLEQNALEKVNKKLKYRGPDLTNIGYFNGWSFLHNLLNITGNVQPQPFVHNGIVCIYNGEIYNYKDFGEYSSDGQCLIPLYEQYGSSFPQKLDGEFALCVIDFTKQIILIASDTFRTKPIFIATEPVFACSTFSEPLKELGATNVESFPPNTIRVYSFYSKNVVEEHRTVHFDLHQYKTNYADWIQAFENAVRKRVTVTNTTPYVCLSSGYDSGGICCALKTLDLSYNIFSIPTNEHAAVLIQREAVAYPNDVCYVTIESTETQSLREEIQSQTENFSYSIWENKSQWSTFSFYEDNASIGIAKICKLAKEKGKRVYLSGSGADEIMSDYSVNGSGVYRHNCFNGVYPENLESIFPRTPYDTDCVWKSFYKSTQEAYLMKEEYIGGSYGIESRYPYLDKQVIQEFLWLTPELKNRAYKAPLDFYMDSYNYPFEKNVKRGFAPLQ